MKVEITLKCSSPKEARLLINLIDMRISAWLDSGELAADEQEELDMLEEMAETIKWQYRVDLLNEFEKLEPEMRNSPKFAEYGQEAEHQDGYGYWMQFDNALQLREDFQLYLNNSD